MAYMECKNVVLGYEGRIISRNINFTVNPGDYLCIVGENGVGKSTLMKTLLNLRKPLEGSIIRGEGIKEHEIGYLPQQTMIQRDFPASVEEVVLSGCLNRLGFRPFYSREEKKICHDNMERMGILNLKGSCYRDLSGGQQQRVLLARALCATSKILVLDEPVAGLDPMVTEEMYELIRRLNKEGITIIMVSHDMDASVKYASHILHMDHEPQFFGTKEDYMESVIYKNFVQRREALHE
ncbi:MAG: metal ABC transporter ATP-binding protein [Lachnospiraceae bacterium]